jgi:hypothetical protein
VNLAEALKKIPSKPAPAAPKPVPPADPWPAEEALSLLSRDVRGQLNAARLKLGGLPLADAEREILVQIGEAARDVPPDVDYLSQRVATIDAMIEGRLERERGARKAFALREQDKRESRDLMQRQIADARRVSPVVQADRLDVLEKRCAGLEAQAAKVPALESTVAELAKVNEALRADNAKILAVLAAAAPGAEQTTPAAEKPEPVEGDKGPAKSKGKR